MQTKQSVTNNHQPSTACGEKRAAMKLPIRSTVIAAFGVLSMLLPVSQTAHAQRTPPPNSRREFVAPVVFQAAGPSGASIQSTVDAFRAVPGFETNNGNNPGPLPDGRREINWDGGSPDVLDTTAPVTPFNVFLNTRGSQFTTPGLGLSQAPTFGGPQGGLAVLFGNITYGKIFRTFSPSRLFTPVGSNITEGLFFIPGTNGTVRASVRGFGAVFTDVDQASTLVEYFGADGNLLFSSSVPASPGDRSLSFFGIVFKDAP